MRMTKIKDIALPTWVQIALVGALVSAGGLLFAQTQKQLDSKANKDTVVQMLKVMELRQNYLEEERKEQKEKNKELRKLLKSVNDQQIILNERLKKP